MMTQDIAVEPTVKAQSIDALAYVKEQFPKQGKEFLVKYCPVGGNDFRVNFFTQDDPSNPFTSSHINRSFYVRLTKKGHSWEHSITI